MPLIRILPILALCSSLLTGTAAAEVRTSPPENPSRDLNYIFYLHGRIIEDFGPRPVSPEFGIYDYAGVLDALSSGGVLVISSQRPANTDVREYAGRVVAQIERLIQAGIAPERIAVVGFSKGGAIALYVSSFLRRPEVRYVIQAGCGEWLSQAPNLLPTGHLLSIIEKSDTLAGTCTALRERTPPLVRYREVQIETGKSHGAFFTPRAEWLEPTLEWARGSP